MDKNITYNSWQLTSLTLLRILIGWHFLYEGLIKFYTPEWTAEGYLNNSIGPFAPLFKSMAQSDFILNCVDLMNQWGLILIGIGLFLGILSKPCKILGMILLLFYYLAYPPFASLGINNHVEGSYWIVNKNLIEMAALFVLYQFPNSCITGLDRFLHSFLKIQINGLNNEKDKNQ